MILQKRQRDQRLFLIHFLTDCSWQCQFLILVSYAYCFVYRKRINEIRIKLLYFLRKSVYNNQAVVVSSPLSFSRRNSYGVSLTAWIFTQFFQYIFNIVNIWFRIWFLYYLNTIETLFLHIYILNRSRSLFVPYDIGRTVRTPNVSRIPMANTKRSSVHHYRTMLSHGFRFHRVSRLGELSILQ